MTTGSENSSSITFCNGLHRDTHLVLHEMSGPQLDNQFVIGWSKDRLDLRLDYWNKKVAFRLHGATVTSQYIIYWFCTKKSYLSIASLAHVPDSKVPGANMGPFWAETRWAPCCPQEPCYLGHFASTATKSTITNCISDCNQLRHTFQIDHFSIDKILLNRNFNGFTNIVLHQKHTATSYVWYSQHLNSDMHSIKLMAQ